MIWFFTPYSLEKKLLTAWDQYLNLVHSPDDWIVMMDGDTAFLRPDFGHVIEKYTRKFPDTGLFTCYASRCHYECQCPIENMDNDSIRFHADTAKRFAESLSGRAVQLNRRVAGHLMVIQKRTWLLIREEVFKTASDKNILGVDTKISNAILNNNRKILLMQELYIFHYLRFNDDINDTKHLKP